MHPIVHAALCAALLAAAPLHAQRSLDVPFVPTNQPTVEAMLRSSGFVILEHPEREVYLVERGKRPSAAEPPPSIRTLIV